MPTQRCWKCNQWKAGVKLCADDLLCPECDQANEEALATIRNQQDSDGFVKVNSKSSNNVKKTNSDRSALVNHSTVDCPAKTVTDNRRWFGGDATNVQCAVVQCKETSGPMLQCVICTNKFHGSCVGIRDETLAVLMPVVDEIGWVCEPCRAAAKSALYQLQSGHTKLWEEVGELKNAYKKLQGEVIRVRSVCKTDTDSLHKEVTSVKTDNLRMQTQVDEIRAAEPKSATPLWPSLQASASREVTAEEAVLAAVHSELSDKQRRACLLYTSPSPRD